jgi:hypothetical protein
MDRWRSTDMQRTVGANADGRDHQETVLVNRWHLGAHHPASGNAGWILECKNDVLHSPTSFRFDQNKMRIML